MSGKKLGQEANFMKTVLTLSGFKFWFILMADFSKKPFIPQLQHKYFNPVLTHSHRMIPFDSPGKQAFRKHCGKRRNCSSRAISPFPTAFSTRWITFCLFRQILNCHLQTFLVWKSLKFVVW